MNSTFTVHPALRNKMKLDKLLRLFPRLIFMTEKAKKNTLPGMRLFKFKFHTPQFKKSVFTPDFYLS